MDRSEPEVQSIREYVFGVGDVLQRLPMSDLDQMAATVRQAWAEGRTVFLLGNGGSAATASHLVCDLAKGLVAPGRPRLKAMAFTDNVPLMTAYGNDVSYDRIFAEQLANFVQPGDVVLAISASGNSPNVLAAVELANQAGATTIGITGFKGGKLKGLVRQCVVVESDNMQQIEDAHMVIGHALFVQLRDGPPPNS